MPVNEDYFGELKSRNWTSRD